MLSLAASFALGSKPSYVYIGPGGCDGADKACKPPSEAAGETIQAFSWDGIGSDLVPLGSYRHEGGVPTWITAGHNDCVFASLSNIDKVISYERSGDGTLKEATAVTSGGAAPVHLMAHPHATLMVANYHGPDDTKVQDGASVASLRVGNQGGVQCSLTPGDALPVTGHSVDPTRQGASHVHSVAVDPHNATRFFAMDLGADKIYTLGVDSHAPTSPITLLHETDAEAGSGPRHSVVHPGLNRLYVLHEMGNVITNHAIKPDGSLALMQKLPLLPSNFTGFSKAAELLITGDGTSLFASNRGYGSADTNTLVGFAIGFDGTLTQASVVPSGVSFPRAVALTFGGDALLVAGETAGKIAAFSCPGHGKLVPHGPVGTGGVQLATPTTIAIVPK